MPTTDAPSSNPWLRSTMDSRRRRRAAARDRLGRLRSRTAIGTMMAALTLVSSAAVAHERPRERAAQPSSGSPVLRVGDRGATVVAVQRRLGIAADGVFGPATRRAVSSFQRRRGLTPDGIVGARTAAALNVSLPAAGPTGGANRSLTGAARTDRLLERIARCESGGNPRAVSPDGRYRGKYQFSRATWRGLGGSGDPARASEAEQDRRAAVLLAQSGTAPWPNCA